MTIANNWGHPVKHAGKQIVLVLLLAAIASGLFWLVSIYANSLRDPRYLDGWILAGGIAVQTCFHVAIKATDLSPKAAIRWRKLHVFLGYVLIAAFVSHSSSLPDTGFGWSLWTAVVLITLSGLFGTYLAWSLKTRGRIDEGVSYDRIPELRAELAEKARATISQREPVAGDMNLPDLPHDGWIEKLYTTHLRTFFESSGRFSAHVVGSKHDLKRLMREIDSLSLYVDGRSRVSLEALKDLAIKKDNLDFARVTLGLARAWLFVHVPLTYALIVLGAVHIVVVYSFSSGTW